MKVQSERAVVDGGNSKIEELKGNWLPELEKLVEKINESFRVNFAEIGCAVGVPSGAEMGAAEGGEESCSPVP